MHIVFFSTSNVFRAEEILIDAKIECKVVPTPVTDRACLLYTSDAADD